MHFRSEIRILTEVSYARAPNGSEKHRTVRSDALECACQSGEKDRFFFHLREPSQRFAAVWKFQRVSPCARFSCGDPCCVEVRTAGGWTPRQLGAHYFRL